MLKECTNAIRLVKEGVLSGGGRGGVGGCYSSMGAEAMDFGRI